jgi:phospholipid/cholesterol/gamma-HCH transport system permease protein
VSDAEPRISFEPKGAELRVIAEGDLVLGSMRGLAEAIDRGFAAAGAPARVVLDLSKAGRLDASGLAVAVRVFRRAKTAGGEFVLEGADADRRLLVELALRGQEPTEAPRPRGFLREVGANSTEIAHLVTDFVRFTGELVLVALRLVRLPRAFQTFDPMAKYGAKLQVADVIAVSIIRELGPLITAIILAGRSGSAFAAEIGTMKVTQEIDALRTFGIDPVRFLVVPRVLATVIVTPMLSVYASILGVAGGYLILGPEGIPLKQYLTEVQAAVDVGGFLQGLVKAAVFALLVAMIGCMAGLRTGQGPGAVGLSTTRAVVAGIVAIVIADAILGAFFYALDI